MNHVSVSPTDGNGPTQGQRKTLTRVGIEHIYDLRVRSPPLYRLSYKVRREQAMGNVGTEDVKVTTMNMYKYKERPPLQSGFGLCLVVFPFQARVAFLPFLPRLFWTGGTRYLSR